MPHSIFPWQAAEMELLLNAKKANRLPHALLLLSRNVNAEIIFVKMFASMMLCTEPLSFPRKRESIRVDSRFRGNDREEEENDREEEENDREEGENDREEGENDREEDGNDREGDGYAKEQPCSICHSCRMLEAGSHPDFIMIEPDGSSIKIDQIRALLASAQETTMFGSYRIICIAKAHTMNLQAANALLKTLEEPTPNTLLILISDQSARLPATILSRCQKIIFKNPARDVALKWLKQALPENSMEECELLLNMAEGSPNTALEYKTHLSFRNALYQGLYELLDKKRDPLQFANILQEYDLTIFFHLLHHWLRDMLRYQLSEGKASLMNSDFNRLFATLSPKITLTHLLEYIDLVTARHKNFMLSQSLNKLLLFEELLIRWIYVSR